LEDVLSLVAIESLSICSFSPFLLLGVWFFDFWIWFLDIGKLDSSSICGEV
jgi:hypothetical protein